MKKQQTVIHAIDEKDLNVTPIVTPKSSKRTEAPSHLLIKINNDCGEAIKPNISTGCDSALVACV